MPRYVRLKQGKKEEQYPMQSAESIMANMTSAKHFSKLDTSSGYLQIIVDDESY